MREITTIRTVKHFNEFELKCQQRIVEKYYHLNDSGDYSHCVDNYGAELGKLGVDTKDIQYCYDMYRKWYVKIPVSKIDLNIDVDSLPVYVGFGYTFHSGGGIMHTGKTNIENNYKGKNKVKLVKIENILEKIARDLKESVEYNNSFEGIAETIRCNEYEFYTDDYNIV
jgi:hypothetical protein